MKTEILDNMAVVSLGVSLWSGQKKLRPEDLRLGAGGALPPADVASLGHKKIIGNDDLNWGKTFKAQLARACLARGTRFLNGYAVPTAILPELTQELDRIVAEARAKKRKFIADYDNLVEAHIAKHSDWKEALRKAITPVGVVDSQIQFSYSVFKLQPAENSGDLQSEVEELGNSALREVAREMQELYRISIVGKEDGFSRKTLGSLWRMRDKLDGLSFLDGAFGPMVKAIDSLLARVGTKGDIPRDVYLECVATILILSDPEEVKNHGKGLLTVAGKARAMEGSDPATEESDAFGDFFTEDSPGMEMASEAFDFANPVPVISPDQAVMAEFNF